MKKVTVLIPNVDDAGVIVSRMKKVSVVISNMDENGVIRGRATAVIRSVDESGTRASVSMIGNIGLPGPKGDKGDKGDPGEGGGGGGGKTYTEGSNIEIDTTDPDHPIIRQAATLTRYADFVPYLGSFFDYMTVGQRWVPSTPGLWVALNGPMTTLLGDAFQIDQTNGLTGTVILVVGSDLVENTSMYSCDEPALYTFVFDGINNWTLVNKKYNSPPLEIFAVAPLVILPTPTAGHPGLETLSLSLQTSIIGQQTDLFNPWVASIGTRVQIRNHNPLTINLSSTEDVNDGAVVEIIQMRPDGGQVTMLVSTADTDDTIEGVGSLELNLLYGEKRRWVYDLTNKNWLRWDTPSGGVSGDYIPLTLPIQSVNDSYPVVNLKGRVGQWHGVGQQLSKRSIIQPLQVFTDENDIIWAAFDKDGNFVQYGDDDPDAWPMLFLTHGYISSGAAVCVSNKRAYGSEDPTMWGPNASNDYSEPFMLGVTPDVNGPSVTIEAHGWECTDEGAQQSIAIGIYDLDDAIDSLWYGSTLRFGKKKSAFFGDGTWVLGSDLARDPRTNADIVLGRNGSGILNLIRGILKLNSGFSMFGHSAPTSQLPHPETLSDVIDGLVAIGLFAAGSGVGSLTWEDLPEYTWADMPEMTWEEI